MRKKGIGLGEAFGAVLTLILIAILIIVGIFLFVSLSTAGPSSARTVVNESITMIGPSTTTLSNTTLCGYKDDVTIVEVWNASVKLSAGNYTLNQANGTIVNLTGSATPWLVSYTSSDGGDFCSSTNTLIVAFGTFPALLGLVGTIIFLGIVIGVLVGSFVFRSKGRA